MMNSVIASQTRGVRGVRTAVLHKALFASTALVGVSLGVPAAAETYRKAIDLGLKANSMSWIIPSVKLAELEVAEGNPAVALALLQRAFEYTTSNDLEPTLAIAEAMCGNLAAAKSYDSSAAIGSALGIGPEAIKGMLIPVSSQEAIIGRALLVRGLSRLGTGRIERGMADLLSAESRLPGEPMASLILANRFARKGKREEAAARYRKVLNAPGIWRKDFAESELRILPATDSVVFAKNLPVPY
ncbi:MAG: hypothetical protein EOP83_18000 [Verrucomicrobiaceae bacterium]|nr:MAG: hypothetical protein EOP83_18000 [Verrucomicrobiaceae bacterium]